MTEQTSPTRPSIDPSEVAKFTAMAAEWWDPKGKFKPLHKFNPVRLGFIRDTVEAHFRLDPAAKRPFEGLRFLDIGCGGGLVSEPMARLGASVTAVDASEANIKTAMTHAEQSGLSIDFRAGTVEELIEAGEAPFDVVLNLEVVEHVADPAQFLKDCAGLVKPGGLMIVATLNRTAKAWALAIVGAEYVLGWLPKGTHEFEKFLRPDEIEAPLKAAGLQVDAPQGVSFNPLSDQWRLSGDTKVNYMMVSHRPGA
ncbi:MAG: bifunctional 2-polyprenyl-6-hydroxyphenol methylase/3-demethylubiquinol 3-O-methyltransferase UbiG [Henriciella sp.]|nr:bifunctional 2-polyprenyl-6-hydroxyphenol methylase/3-demethylubiquinol 3-O-methyltransferase UbiG [Hyphomonadaceae bacterium]